MYDARRREQIVLVDLADASLPEALDFVRAQTGKQGKLNPVQFVYRIVL